MVTMSRSAAVDFLKEQEWVESAMGMHMPFAEREGIVHRLRAALDILGMGYDGDFNGIHDKERDVYCNFNVDKAQFLRVGIDPGSLKKRERNTAPAAPVKKTKKRTAVVESEAVSVAEPVGPT